MLLNVNLMIWTLLPKPGTLPPTIRDVGTPLEHVRHKPHPPSRTTASTANTVAMNLDSLYAFQHALATTLINWNDGIMMTLDALHNDADLLFTAYDILPDGAPNTLDNAFSMPCSHLTADYPRHWIINS
ncbi:hypothetical protein AC578_9952 [Pseudocercospora eumusae]|uniref:Uncharacterized protein n=1 Tax=Pseudocercospora eumusae TaxID=321146 RepID=A0A139H0D3_9PEZI|nr:hypothetical protein AC578_9952 [Pseudocercospora eumusae]